MSRPNISARRSSGSPAHVGVSTIPGETALTRIGASSTASVLTAAATAPFTAAVATPPAIGVQAATPERSVTEPSEAIRACRIAVSGPQSFVSKATR